MDCRNFKDVLDSYLSGELAVETNHECLRHAEQCPPCRAELGARRHLRTTLRAAAMRTVMSAEARDRLRARLRAEAEPVAASSERARWFVWPEWFSWNWALPAMAAVLLAVGWFGLHTRQQPLPFAELSAAVMAEAAGDHQTCALQFANAKTAATTPDWMKEKYPAYAGLVEAAAAGAQGMQLNAVHVCSFKARKFGHLVYAQNDKLISLLVTPRDTQSLRGGQPPADDGVTAGLQHALSSDYQVSAYQTAKYVVLVVSDLSETENNQLAARLAALVSAHLRQIEKSVAAVPEDELKDLLAELRGQHAQARERGSR